MSRPDASRFAELAGGRKLKVVAPDGSTIERGQPAQIERQVKTLEPELLQIISNAVDTASEKADQVIAAIDKPKAKERWSFTVFRDENNRISLVEAVQL